MKPQYIRYSVLQRKVKFVEAFLLFGCLGFLYAVVRLNKKGQGRTAKIDTYYYFKFFDVLHIYTRKLMLQHNPCQSMQIYKELPNRELLHPFYRYLVIRFHLLNPHLNDRTFKGPYTLCNINMSYRKAFFLNLNIS